MERIKLSTEEFIKQSSTLHNNFYSYDKCIYVNCRTQVTVTCPLHGDFKITPKSHLYSKCGCQKCGKISSSIKNRKVDNFIQKSSTIHNNKYNYSKVIYKRRDCPVELICPLHGSFWQKPNHHINGSGCKKCAKIKEMSNRKNPTGYSRKNWIKNATGKECCLYVVQYIGDKSFIKVGITNNLKRRLYQLKHKDFEIDLLQTLYDIPEVIWDTEQLLHKTFLNNKLKYQNVPTNSRECYPIEFFDIIFKFIQNERKSK